MLIETISHLVSNLRGGQEGIKAAPDVPLHGLKLSQCSTGEEKIWTRKEVDSTRPEKTEK